MFLSPPGILEKNRGDKAAKNQNGNAEVAPGRNTGTKVAYPTGR